MGTYTPYKYEAMLPAFWGREGKGSFSESSGSCRACAALGFVLKCIYRSVASRTQSPSTTSGKAASFSLCF